MTYKYYIMRFQISSEYRIINVAKTFPDFSSRYRYRYSFLRLKSYTIIKWNKSKTITTINNKRKSRTQY